jgi:GrpB protein
MKPIARGHPDRSREEHLHGLLEASAPPSGADLAHDVPKETDHPDRSGGIQLTNRPAEVAAQVPMHRVAARTGPHPSDVGTTAAPQPPIGRYRRVPVQVHQADPDAPQVARRLIALIATRWPATPAEHMGSSAVPGLAGKNIIDLLLAAEPTHIPAVTQALLELGFQRQSPAAFPASRPMLWGAFRHGATEYGVHVHVVPAACPAFATHRRSSCTTSAESVRADLSPPLVPP